MNAENKPLIVISGTSSGIGLAMAREMLERGYAVLGLVKDAAGDKLAHPQYRQEPIDLANPKAVEPRIRAIIANLGQPVRALVNNAGIGRMGHLEQLSLADMELVMNTNFLSHAIVTKAFLPLLKGQGRGDIVFIGSEAALRGGRQGSLYCASKFAIRGFAQSLREECGKSGVRVSLINPGAVRTPFFDELHFEPGENAENALAPEDIAAALAMIIEARPGAVLEEINLSPRIPSWRRK
ncbi:MAG: SDR family NAD(P)-dependent oxidoreductase [Gammaproteobacteria bacterium]|nr:SDR family NAD(P)-dependent oxidoreductase [Gammaproteobacteria bacterium]